MSNVQLWQGLSLFYQGFCFRPLQPDSKALKMSTFCSSSTGIREPGVVSSGRLSMKKKIALVVLSTILAGCMGTGTKEEPKKEVAKKPEPIPADEVRMVMAGDYKTVYRKVLPFMRGCNTGRISHLDALLVKDSGGFGQIVINDSIGPVVTARFEQYDKSQTQVKVKFASLSWEPVAKTVLKWADGTQPICPKKIK
ncbi:hypothetical protein ACKC9G_01755 [Pokkaliibacter sp. CJK22405]|uniref:hypothetical protein n=1 Tax=Pokkaliibacter sp. CJK22405 TaxID=3384615 RepID=UPI0039853C0B